MKEIKTDAFSEKLASLRKSHGMTQEQLGQALCLSRSCIANYESGNRQPDAELLSQIADYFDVSTDFLMGRNSIEMVFHQPKSNSVMGNLKRTMAEQMHLDLTDMETKDKLMVVSLFRYMLATA